MRLIDADALREKATNAKKYDPEMMVVGLGYVFSAPTIDPVKHGRWLNFYGNYSTAECSCCGSCFEVTFDEEANAALWAGFLEFYKFCPNCGARMDADE